MIAFISSGAIQLLVGPASFSSTEQMKVRSSTRATSLGSEAQWNELGLMSGLSRVNVPAATSSSVSRVHSCSEPVTQEMRSGVVRAATSATQAASPSVGRAAVTRDVGPGRERLGRVCCRRHLLGHPFRGPVLAAHVRCGEAFPGPRRGGCPHAERVLLRPTYARRGGRDTGNLSAVGETAHKDSGSCRVSDIPLSKRTPPTGNQQKAPSVRRLTSGPVWRRGSPLWARCVPSRRPGRAVRRAVGVVVTGCLRLAAGWAPRSACWRPDEPISGWGHLSGNLVQRCAWFVQARHCARSSTDRASDYGSEG